ncbi:MAG: Ig-like domain repeat protein [Methanobrevibacter sp.]|nr:Ig-like domain repeat protein [Methanobrevibacter sp.]
MDIYKVNGELIVNVPTTLVPGRYDVNVTVDESENHTAGNAHATLTVGPATGEINLTADNITYGGTVIITPSALEGATGNLEYTIKNSSGAVVREGTKAIGESFDVSDLAAGTYTVTATYRNDPLYSSVTVNGITFNVSKAVPEFDASALDVVYGTNITVVPNANVNNGNVNYTVKDKDGNVVVNGIKGVSESFTAKLAAGKYTVNATYLGNQNYTASTVVFNVTVSKANSTVVIDVEKVYDYNDTIIINLTTTGSNGVLNVTINGKVYPVNTEKQVVIENITAGEYTIIANLAGDENYTAIFNSTTFKVKKATTSVEIGVKSIYKVGDVIEITLTTVNLTDLTVTVNGVVKEVDENNKITITNAKAGDYIVNAVLAGNDNYTGSNDTKSFKVVKNNVTISVNSTTVPVSIVVGSPVTFTANLNESVTGDVIFTIGDANYTVPIENKDVATYTYTPANNATIAVVATFAGNDKYNAIASAEKQFGVKTVPTDVNVTVKTPVTYGNDAVITVELNVTINATVKLSIDDKKYDVAIVNGKGGFNASGLTSGNHNIDVVFAGDGYYERSTNSTTFTVDKAELGAKVTALNVTVSDNTSFIIDAIGDFKGNVSIKSGDNVLYNGSVKTIIDASRLPAGDYVATAVFYGDNNYNKSTLDNIKFTVSRVTPTITVEISDVTFPANATATIKVSNKANGTVNITVGTKVFKGSVNNGSATITLNNLSAGSKVAKVEFFTNDAYNGNATASAKFNVNKANSTVVIDVEKVYVYNDNIIINLTANGSPGAVNVTINGKVYPVNADMQIVIESITAGEYTIIADLTGNENYTGASNSTTFKVKKAETSVSIGVDSVYKVGDNVIIILTTDNATDLTVMVNGEVKPVNADNTVIISNADAGDYIVNAIIKGNENYTGSNDTKSFKVVKNIVSISVNSTTVPASIVVGSPVTFTANLNDSVTGDVIFTINGANYTVHITGKDVATYKYTPINNDTITVIATFDGNDNYNTAVSAPEEFNVNKVPTSLSVSIDKTSIYVGENAVVSVTLNQSVTGVVTVRVNGKDYLVSVVNGEGSLTLSDLAKGNYNIGAVFAGDGKYVESTSNNVTLKVNQITTSVDVTFESSIVAGEDALIKVNMNPKINGTVKLNVGDMSYNVAVVNGVGTLTVSNLANGTYNVKAEFAGDDKYSGSSSAVKKLMVNMVTTKLSISIDKTSMTVDDKAVVSAVLNPSITDVITVRVNGKEYPIAVVDGKGSLTLSDLAKGTYDIDAVFAGDDKYTESTSGTVTLEVKGKTVTEMSVDIDVEKGIATVVLPDDATGNVTVVIDGKVYNVTDITESPVTIGIGELKPGNHTIEVIYSGDDFFTPDSNITDVEVPRVDDYEITADARVDGSSVDITVSLPKDIFGPVLIDVDGVGYYANAENGQAKLHLDDLSKGKHDVVVTYPGDDKYASKGNSTSFNIDAKETPMSIVVGDDEVVVVLPGDATGSVTVSIDGKTQTVPVEGGKAVVDISGLEPGQHTVEASYPGDDNYGPASNSTVFEVPKISDYPIVVSEEDDKLVVNVPKDATGDVKVTIDGKEYTAPIKDGKAVVDISDLEPGKHAVEVTYPGDKKYAQASNATVVDIPKADDYKITATAKVDGTSADITVTLPKDATGPVLIDVNGVGYYANAENGQAKLHLDDLSKGKYDVVVTYPGDDKYASKGNSTSFNIDAKETPMSINVKDDEIVVELPSDATGNVTVSIDGKTQTVPVEGGKAVVDISGLEPGQHTVEASYPGDDNYGPASNSTVFEVPKISDYPIVVSEEDDKLVVNVPKDATGDVKVTIDGKEYTAPIKDGKAVVDISDLEPGKHAVDVTYPGDKKYAQASNATVVEIPKISDYPFEVKAEDIYVGEKTDITVSLPKDVNGQVLVDINGIGYYVNVTDGVAHVDLPLDLEPGSYDAIVTFPGNDKYESKTVKDSFNVAEKETTIIISVEDDNIVIELPKDATGNVDVSINGKTQTVPIKDGKAVVDISDLEPGNYTVVANYPGDGEYPPASNSTSFEVPKVSDYPMNMTNTDDELTINVPKDATGDVKVTIDGKDYTVPIKDGKAVLDISGLPNGNHDVKVTYPGNDKYASKTITGIIVKERSLIMTAPDVVKYYHGPERFVVYLTDDKGNKLSGLEVKITINGQTYTRTSENGEASIALGLISGNYTVDVKFEGNDEFKPQSINASVEIRPTIYANDVFKVYKNGTQYYALFVDSEGVPLANTEVSFNINGVFYHRTTNESGWAKLNINLPEGEYQLTAINPVTNEMRTNNVTVITLIESSDLTKYYRNGSQFIVRIHSDDGGWAQAGEEVTFNINGVFYTRTTNETGHVKLNINIAPGDYVITTSYKGCLESNNIHVLPRLITSDLTMKYHDGSTFVAKTLDEQGNPAPHQEVSFNVNGILYSRITNDNGEAAITINLQAGKYIITSQYGYERNSNTIIIEA